VLQVAVDVELLSKLKGLSEPLELIDSRGRVLAQVVPVNGSHTSRLPGEPDWDEADLQRQEQANERWYTTAEVLEYLKNLGTR
jgi:hypothetical protein